jgi:hypothetical protein
VHFYWLTEQILPHVNIVVDHQRQKTLETIINQTTWAPYDPDREKTWQQLLGKIRTA